MLRLRLILSLAALALFAGSVVASPLSSSGSLFGAGLDLITGAESCNRSNDILRSFDIRAAPALGVSALASIGLKPLAGCGSACARAWQRCTSRCDDDHIPGSSSWGACRAICGDQRLQCEVDSCDDFDEP